jgi:hypothetical protein
VAFFLFITQINVFLLLTFIVRVMPAAGFCGDARLLHSAEAAACPSLASGTKRPCSRGSSGPVHFPSSPRAAAFHALKGVAGPLLPHGA